MKLTLTCAPAGVAVLALGLAACSSSPAGSSATAPNPAPSSPSRSVSAPASPSPSTSVAPSGTGADGARIGGPAVVLPEGAKVAVGEPTYYPTADNGVGVSRTGNVLTLYPVTITNTGKTPIDATLTAVNAYAGGEQVDGLQDMGHPANNITGTILPGRAKNGTYSFLTRKGDKGKMQVEVYVPTTPVQAHAVFTDGDGAT